MILKSISNKKSPLILPLLASIPTFIFIFNSIFSSSVVHHISSVIIETLFPGEISLLVFLLLLIFLGYLFCFDLFIISPWLSYIFFKSLNNKTSLPRRFWLMNILFFVIPLLILFLLLIIFECPIILIDIENPFYNFFYGVFLFLIGISCSTNLFKNKKFTIALISIFTIFYFYNGFTSSHAKEFDFRFFSYYFHFLFFAEIFLFKQLRDKPYLKRNSLGK